jgi:hypothetical protein
MSATERISDITLAWNLLLPQIPMPAPEWFGRIAVYSVIQRGLTRASKKFGTQPPTDSGVVAKYVLRAASFVLKDQEAATRDQNPALRW